MVRLALVSEPRVTSIATSADKVMSIMLFAGNVTRTLPLYIEFVPTESVCVRVAAGILVLFTRTASVTVVPKATERLVK